MWLWYLDDVHLKVDLTRFFVSNSGDDFYLHWWDKLIMCNYIYSDLHSFVTNGPCNYCIELWLTLDVSLIKLSWKFLMLVLGMNCFDWIVKKEKKKKILQVPLGCISHTLDPFGFGMWHIFMQKSYKLWRFLSHGGLGTLVQIQCIGWMQQINSLFQT